MHFIISCSSANADITILDEPHFKYSLDELNILEHVVLHSDNEGVFVNVGSLGSFLTVIDDVLVTYFKQLVSNLVGGKELLITILSIDLGKTKAILYKYLLLIN